MGNDSILQVVLKVKDEMSPILPRIGERFTGIFSKMKASAKQFFDQFSDLNFEKVSRLAKAPFEMISKFGAKLRELAPDAKKFTESFSDQEMQTINKAAESYNRLGASMNTFIGQMIAAVPGLNSAMESLANTMDRITGIDERSKDRAALLKDLADAQAAFSKGAPSGSTPGSALEKEYLRLHGAVIAAREALKSYDRQQKAMELKPALDRLAKDVEDEMRIRAANQAAGVALRDTRQGPGAVSHQAQRDIAELRRMSDAWVEETNNKLLPTVENIFQQGAEAAKQAEDDMLDDTANMLRAKGKMYDDDRKAFEKSEEDKLKAAQELTDQQIAALRAFEEKSSLIRAENAERLRQQMEAEIEAINQQIEQVAGIMSSAFLSSFEEVIRGTKSVADAFAQMVGSIMYDVGRMMASEALTGLFRDLLKGLYGGSSGANLTDSGIQGGSLDLPRYAPSTSGGRTGVTININGARDATAVAREVRTAVMNLASTDSGVRRRLQLS
jgi:uncharacterized phage infection (PIP) family protein YhgE